MSILDDEEAIRGLAVIITGAGQGIGAAHARYLAERGASVLVADIVYENAAAVAEEITAAGGSAVAFAVDVSSWESCQAMVAAAADAFGRLDGLVNNAGVLHLQSPFDEVDIEGARRVLNVNLLGSYAAGLAAIQYMSAHSGGSIVNVTSGVQSGLTDAASYSASKGGIASLTYSWALDCVDRGIRVNAISPVATTPMTIGTDQWLRGQGQAVAEHESVDPSHNCPPVAYFLSPLSRHITGQILRTHGTTLQLVGHPVVIPPELTRDEWTIADVAEAVDDVFAAHLPRLGMHAATVEYVQLSKFNAVPGVQKYATDPAG